MQQGASGSGTHFCRASTGGKDSHCLRLCLRVLKNTALVKESRAGMAMVLMELGMGLSKEVGQYLTVKVLLEDLVVESGLAPVAAVVE